MDNMLASVVVGRTCIITDINLVCRETSKSHGIVEIELADNGTYRLDTSKIECAHCKRRFERFAAKSAVKPAVQQAS